MQLYRSVDHGDVEDVRRRLAAGEDVNARDDGFWPFERHTPLTIAAASPDADREMLAALVEAGADLNYCLPAYVGSKTAMGLAAAHGAADKVAFLLEVGADPTRPKRAGPLAYAVTHDSPDRIELVRLLAEHVVERPHGMGQLTSALKAAACGGDREIIQLLLAMGADGSALEWTPLMEAVAWGTVADVRRLAKPEALWDRDVCEYTPWLLSVMMNDVPKAACLLEAGAALEDWAGNEGSGLMLASSRGHESMVRWLIEQGADVNAAGWSGETAVVDAALAGCGGCVRAFFEAGVAPDTKDMYGDRLIHDARSLAAFDALVEAGADPTSVSGEGYTPLMSAVERRDREMIRGLLERGVRDDPTPTVKATALHVAVRCDDPVAVAMLIEAGSDVNHEYDDERPLHRVRSLRVARQLLEAGANPLTEDIIGRLPSEVVQRAERDEELAAFLRRAEHQAAQ